MARIAYIVLLLVLVSSASTLQNIPKLVKLASTSPDGVIRLGPDTFRYHPRSHLRKASSS